MYPLWETYMGMAVLMFLFTQLVVGPGDILTLATSLTTLPLAV